MTIISAFKHPLVSLLALAFLMLGCTHAHADHHAVAEEEAPQPIRVGILTGQNNHAWMNDTPAMQSILDDAGLFETTIVQTPDRNAANKAELWEQFRPDFTEYDVIVLNYNGENWPDHVKDAFVAYISGGGKAYTFHAGNNPFRGWAEYEQMVGLLWRPNNMGRRLFFDADGNEQFMEAGEGPGAGHGRKHAYLVNTRETEHPIFAGLPTQWMHAEDELYHGQRGPAENMTVLLTAHADADTRGTGVIEPIAWTIPFGDGLVLTNVMGHWMGDSGPALQCAGFQTIFTRSIEWLATGQVTLPVPDDFPTAEATSSREIEFEPLAYIHVHGQAGSDPHASCGCTEPTEPWRNPFWSQYAQMTQALPDQAAAQR